MKINHYELSKHLKRIRKLLVVVIVFTILIAGIKHWIVKTKNEINDVYNNSKDYFSSQEFKENNEDQTQDAINSIISLLVKSSKALDKGAASAREYIENAYSNASDEETEEPSNKLVNINDSLQQAELWCVIDGDTIIVIKDGVSTKVRLIGINTPESVHQNEEKNNIYGKAASEWLEAYMKDNGFLYGKPLYLQFDVEDKDIYDRTLAYVWLKNDINTENEDDIRNYMLNSIIVSEGFAEDVVYEPNHKYANYFNKFFKEAKESGIGLWSYEDFDSFEGK